MLSIFEIPESEAGDISVVLGATGPFVLIPPEIVVGAEVFHELSLVVAIISSPSVGVGESVQV
jgi:hypothetical protein